MASTGANTRPHGLPSKYMYESLVFHSTLGEGQYGSVWKCTDRTTGEVLACKQMNKKKHPKSVDREATCFVRVQSHDNVVGLRQLYEDEENIYFLMELCNGGDLLPVICKSGGLSEQISSAIFWQLVQATEHCHVRGVIHRDIKPENVLLHSPGPDGVPTVKLADFGLATWVKPGKLAQGWVGSPPYEAPEVIELKPYDTSADVWSLGIVLYGMLSANWPSFQQGRRFNRKIDFQAPIWQGVSAQAKSLIIRMLASNPAERPTCPEILRDDWFAALLPHKVAELPKFEPLYEEFDCPSSALPIDFLPTMCLGPPAVLPYRQLAAPRTSACHVAPAARPQTPEPREAPRSSNTRSTRGREAPAPAKVPRSEGSFGNWLGDDGDDAMSQKMAVELLSEASHAWKPLSLSRTGSSSKANNMIAPPSVPYSDSSTSSAPSSPDSKPSHGCQAGSAKQVAGDFLLGKGGSFTRSLGKRLLQIVSDTLTGNPMCSKLNGSGSQAYGAQGACREQEGKRPSTATGRRTTEHRAL